MQEMFVCQFHDLSHDGLGVGKVGQKVIFVDGVLPDEIAQVTIQEEKKNFVLGQLIEIQKFSIDRQDPICPYFSHCGGCQTMHLRYEKSLEIKKRRVLEQLKKADQSIHRIPVSIQPSGEELFYRNKIEVKVQGEKVGFYKKKSHELLDIQKCFIAKPILNHVLRFFQNEKLLLKNLDKITFRTNQKQTEVTVIIHAEKKVNPKLIEKLQQLPFIVGCVQLKSGYQTTILFGKSCISEEVLGTPFAVDALAFMQINLPQAEKLYQKIMEKLNPCQNELILDAYCGIGILACLMGKQGANVIGLDVVKQSIDSAKENAKNLKLDQLKFFQEPFEKARSIPKAIDTIILNPPRGGCDDLALSKVLEMNPSKLVYVSCDPSTLARDLKKLLGSYSIKSIDLFDLFPQTMHVETLVYLEKSS